MRDKLENICSYGKKIIEELKNLPAQKQKKILEVVRLLKTGTEATHKEHSITELKGCGKKSWKGIDAQEYVNKLREEWNGSFLPYSRESIPIEDKNQELMITYEDLLTNSNNLILTDIDRNVAVESAKLRAKYKIKIPDAIQLASGLINGATAFITNDGNLKKIKEIKVIVLDDIVK